jgi:hypothetical protein
MRGGGLRTSGRTLAQRLKWTAFRLQLAIEDRRNQAFDARHGVETAREIPLEAAGVGHGDVRRGNTVYRATWEPLIRRAIDALGIDHSRYSFVDYGAGKGKAMLVAADYPFRRIVGVEYAPRLHEVARSNCERYRSAAQRCFDFEVQGADVLRYQPPPGPLVCFMCNPFDAATLQQVFESWRRRCEGGESDLRILYLNMRDVREAGRVLTAQTWLDVDARSQRFVSLRPSPSFLSEAPERWPAAA